MTVPGVGPVTASAIMATIEDVGDFASGREFATFLGLTPRQSSTGGKPRLGRITKMGDRHLRKLLVKLLIALWRFVIDGVVPRGAVMKPSMQPSREPGSTATALQAGESEGTSPIFGMAPQRRLKEWCRSFEALPSNAGQWPGS
jgi:hypothetical protein